MGSIQRKPNFLRNVFVRCFSFAVIVLAVRLTCFVELKGGTCRICGFCSISSQTQASHSAATLSQKRVDYFLAVFQDLIADGYLSPEAKSLCIGEPEGEDAVAALKDIGVWDSIGISKKASLPSVVSSKARLVAFDDNTFDFEFFGEECSEQSTKLAELSSEMCRTMRPGGFLVVHTMAKDSYSLHSLLNLFNCCKLVEERNINGHDTTTIHQVVMKKEPNLLLGHHRHRSGRCSVPGFKREIIREAEPLIEQEPSKPWITFKKNLKNIKYLTSMADISFKRKYIYVDVGARSYRSSMGSWFEKKYPKQNKSFSIYAIEADKAFRGDYAGRKGVSLLPYAAWVRNETLFFEITRGEKGTRVGGIQEKVKPSTGLVLDRIEGIDLAEWLKSVASEEDFVVMKMDVEGAEFDVVKRMKESGALCLVDEMFMECHYNRWQRCCKGRRSPKYRRTYAECLKLMRSLRDSGVLAHHWW